MGLIHASLSERDVAARRLFGLPAKAVPAEELSDAMAREAE
jgi:hypothetical protein